MRENHDEYAPDGYLIGGERLVRSDGTILFQRGWWQVPKEWAGEYCFVECMDGGAADLAVAPPGYSCFSAAAMDGATIRAPRTGRPDARPALRNKANIAWYQRFDSKAA